MSKLLDITEVSLKTTVPQCRSWRNLCLRVGVFPDTRNFNKLRARVSELEIDTSHFLGQASSRGVPSPNKKPVTAYLIYGKPTMNSHSLKLRLIVEGIKENKCEKCNNVLWMGQQIPLELHHIDGDNYNNRIQNLQIICPNCHAQTDTYRTKNIKK